MRNFAPRRKAPSGSDASRVGWIVVAFVIAFLAVGVMYWNPDYDVELPSSLFKPWLVLVALAGALARVAGRIGSRFAILIVGSAVPAAIVAPAVADRSGSIAANLELYGVVASAMVGYGTAAIGSMIAMPWAKKK